MLERFSATVEADLLRRFDHFLKRKAYGNRSEGVRDLIRKALVEEEWRTDAADVMGVISLVYDHHQPDLLRRLTDLQHDAEAMIISTTHIHMDHHNCLEIIVTRGKAAKVRKLADRLFSLRGVKNGKLSGMTTGESLP